MPYREIAPFPKRLTIVVGLCVVGGMAFGLALSYYNNVLFDHQLLTFEENNQRLKHGIVEGYHQLEYLESTQYRDKYAKENIGLINTGEKVFVLLSHQESEMTLPGHELTPEEKKALFEENLRKIPVYRHWQLLLFHRDMIEELKKRA